MSLRQAILWLRRNGVWIASVTRCQAPGTPLPVKQRATAMRPNEWCSRDRKLRMRFPLVTGAMRLRMPLSLLESGVPPARFTCVFVLSRHAPPASRTWL